ncbi:slipin family protein [Shewanella sp. C32]|uniref:Slipin family protein n=1 Tax=Shewanella electrica TaxID=515560 RepID=A0ABT2FM09_9GAMM|nr:slipin family protein [Shewanella electrica]MCH1924345.1 slipin family protein [Shewanella electrica]MCS4556246.1 slipin family protein [Shewanella electrica]
MFNKKIVVADNERVLVFKAKQLVNVLQPGEHKLRGFGDMPELKTYDIGDLYFAEENTVRWFNKYPLLAEHIAHFHVTEQQTGLLYLDDQLKGIVTPGCHLYLWREAGDIRLDTFDIANNLVVDEATLTAIKKVGANSAQKLIRSSRTQAIIPVKELTVPMEQAALLYVDGKYVRQLGAGRYGFWQFQHDIVVKTIDLRHQLLEVSGQEILSKDRVSLRINLNANVRVFDAELALMSTEKVMDYVYNQLQLALREAVGVKTLDDLLLDKLYVNETVKELVVEPLKQVGVELMSVGMKDIILPGDMKAILNQVVEAQKAAEANVIKRREETAATRSLHNTAKMMENNPTLMRLKELESLEKVAEKIENLTVYGGLEGLMNGVVKIA